MASLNPNLNQRILPAPMPKVAWLRLIGTGLFSFFALTGVYINEEIQRKRRHTSIAKDIEREEWRAREIAKVTGRDPLAEDDGFAQEYRTDPRNKRDMVIAQEEIGEVERTGRVSQTKLRWW